jgi:Ca2+-binding RTX toxin-like protein
MAELPSTNYDEEIEMTDGTEAVLGGDGNTLILAQANSFTTLNDSDVIDGGGGTNTTRFASSGEDNISIKNFTQTNVQNWETRNQVDGGDVEVFFSFVDGLETFWWNNSYGDYSWYFDVQDPADLVFSSGDTAVDIDFANSVTMDMLDILLDGGAEVDDLYVNYYMGNMIPNVAVHSQGGGTNDLGLWAWGATGLTISGDTNLDFEHWKESNDDSDANTALSTINASALTGGVTLDLEARVGDNGGPGPVTVLTQGESVDILELNFDYNSDGVVKTGLKADNLTINNSDNLTVKSGNGHDIIDINDADGDVFLGSGKGRDDVSVHTINGGSLTGDTGTNSNADTLKLYVNGSVGTMESAFLTGGGDDVVTGRADVDLFLDVGDGNNTIGKMPWGNNDLDVGRDAHITALGGNDFADIHVRDDFVGNFGGGDDTLFMRVDDIYNPIGDPVFAADVTMGGGNDFVRADVNSNMRAFLNAGNDTIGITNVDGYVYIGGGSGNDLFRTGDRGITNADTLRGGTGNNTLFAGGAQGDTSNGLSFINSNLAFDNASKIQNVVITDDLNQNSSQSIDFDGIGTKANDAGVLNYFFDIDPWQPNPGSGGADGQIQSNYNMTNLTSGSTLDIGLNGGSLDFFNLDLVDGVNTSATVNLHLKSSTTWQDFDVNHTDELTFNAIDKANGVPTVTIGNGATFTGNGLSTLNLTGNSHITMQSIISPSLATIAGGSMTGNANLTLNGVAEAIAVTTGDGNDTITGNDTTTAYTVTTGDDIGFDGNDTVITQDMDDTISTGSGNDQVTSGAGIDSINLGSGNDNATFVAADLTAADTVAGGTHTTQDTVTITSGELDRNDEFFFKWSGIEHLILSGAQDDLVVGAIAEAAGLDEITLNGGGDTLNLVEGFLRDLQVNIFSNDTVLVDATGVTLGVSGTNNDLTISGLESAFDAADTLMAGTGTNDELLIEDSSGSAVLGSMVTGFEKITVVDTDHSHWSASVTTDDANVDAGKTMTVNNSIHSGSFNFDGSAETDGHFNVTSNSRPDVIMTGAGNDTINSGSGTDIIDTGEGNNTVTTTGTGNDTIDTYTGTDSVTTASGNDNIETREGVDNISSGGGVDTIDAGDGNDTVDAGSGDDFITGGLGADMLTGGAGADDFIYGALADSSGLGMTDTVLDFVSGVDEFDFSVGAGLFAATAFVGNAATFGSAQGGLTVGNGIEIVYQQDDQVLWVDINDDATLNADDLQIALTGITEPATLASGDFILV